MDRKTHKVNTKAKPCYEGSLPKQKNVDVLTLYYVLFMTGIAIKCDIV